MPFFTNSSSFRFPNLDPYASGVVLLMHFEGSDGSTSFIDEKGHVFSITDGDPVITGLGKFGSGGTFIHGGEVASLERIATPNSADFNFGSGDFTVEYFWAPVGETDHWGANVGNESGLTGWRMYVDAARLVFKINDANLCVQSISPTANSVFLHLAVCRSGATTRVFRNGVQLTSFASVNQTDSTAELSLSTVSNVAFAIDEWRITKGFARYTEDFDPPTGPFT